MQRLACLAIAALIVAWSGAVVADDGELFRKDVSKTPEEETHHAALTMLKLYVPAQTSDGALVTIAYETLVDDAGFVTERNYARPLVAIYEDGPVEYPPDCGGFYGHGERDLFGAVSLDDGATWKRSNLSRSADRSSIRIDRKPYPGDVFRNFAVSAGNSVLAVWASRYCESGGPNYSLEDAAIEALFASDLVDLGDLTAEACTDADDPATTCLYFEDYWHVAGSQGIADMAEEEYPTVGEVPYACLWTARGTLEAIADDAGGTTYEMVWRQAERLTSGVRDVHRMEAACVAGAGCVVTWQEDPDGLRPGKGEGPGEGWSGAIAHHETDIWYSYIDWDNFGLVTDGDTIVPFSESTSDSAPKAAVPFSMPVRLTDNAMCTATSTDPFCSVDFDLDGSGASDSCASTVDYQIETPVGTDTLPMCVSEDGRLMRGNTASTRARTHLHGYDTDADGTTDRAWVVLAYEESKGLGDEDEEDEADKVDMGKNIWYHTFDMFEPELVSQGLQLNQPAVYPAGFALGELTGYTLNPVDIPNDDTGNFFVTVDPDPIYGVAGLDSELYQSEIARRFSLISQDASVAADTVGGTVAFAMFKQGIVRQGGPADIFARRFVLPLEFDPAVDNPYDYANMACDDWATFAIEPNPRYVKGLCLSPAINLSGSTVLTCEDNSAGTCDHTAFPFDDLFSDIAGTEGEGIPGVYTWRQCDASGANDCPDTLDDTLDTSWENPFDMAKGHRGFIKGDFLMVMYVWTPNWSANTVGHENANLYIRRSFDGGLTWTTTPADFSMDLPDGVTVTADGTEHCEWYFDETGSEEVPTCFTYGAGEFEQARNVSQLTGTHLTVLDPRFTPTPGSIVDPDEGVDDGFLYDLYADDVTDPSKFYATFETGDTDGVAEGGEAVPMDLNYARATNYGDDYDLALAEESDSITLPDECATDDPDCEFSVYDWLENKSDDHASEAAVTTNPGGTMFYAIWNQWKEDEDEVAYDSDAIFRRTLELGDSVGTLESGGDGTPPSVPDPPGKKPKKSTADVVLHLELAEREE